MISEERIKAIEEYKFEVCPQMGMNCQRCICADCPRDCKECEQSGVEGYSEQCIYIGNGRYRT
jgi:hypothetical protein